MLQGIVVGSALVRHEPSQYPNILKEKSNKLFHTPRNSRAGGGVGFIVAIFFSLNHTPPFLFYVQMSAISQQSVHDSNCLICMMSRRVPMGKPMPCPPLRPYLAGD